MKLVSVYSPGKETYSLPILKQERSSISNFAKKFGSKLEAMQRILLLICFDLIGKLFFFLFPSTHGSQNERAAGR